MNRAVVLAMMAVGAGAGSLACGSAFAQGADENDEGFYIGGGVGQFNLKLDDVDQTDEAIESLDDSDTAWKAFAGWVSSRYTRLARARRRRPGGLPRSYMSRRPPAIITRSWTIPKWMSFTSARPMPCISPWSRILCWPVST